MKFDHQPLSTTITPSLQQPTVDAPSLRLMMAMSQQLLGQMTFIPCQFLAMLGTSWETHITHYYSTMIALFYNLHTPKFCY